MAALSLCLLLTWIFLLSLFRTRFAEVLCHADENSALMEFKRSFRTDTTDWPCVYSKVDSWRLNGSADCCSWDGIECDEVTGRVIALNLSSSCLSGTMSPNTTLFRLVHMESLNLAFNSFNFSSIPYGFGNLSKLQYLNLSNSKFSGEIPRDISQLSKLVSLDLSTYWDETLRMPNMGSFVHNLTRLKELDLSLVSLSSPFPPMLANFSSFKSLKLASCGLNGNIPVSIFQLPNLEVLSIAHNSDLSGFFPKPHWGSPLKSLHLSSTNFSGEIPTSIGNLSLLNELKAWGCYFSGSLPSSMVNLSHLIELDLGTNNLGGDSLEWMVNLTKLTILDISGNRLSGGFPSSFENLKQLTSLDLSYNDLHGDILGALRNLKNLEFLNLESLNLNGVLDVNDLFTLKNLTSLDLSNNNISFTKSFINTTTSKLAYLYLDSCNLTEFPRFIGYLSELEELNLQYNRIRGNLLSNGFSSSSENLKRLTSLDLSYNDLHGDILGALRNLKSLEFLNLESLNPNGVLDVNDLFTLKNLTSLDLSNNNISFTKSFINTTTSKLAYLYLDSCNLTEFPRFIGYLSELEVLHLQYSIIRGNLLSNGFPSSSENLKRLTSLDLCYNDLHSDILGTLRNLKNLEFLNLESLNFNGVLDVNDLFTLKNLRILYLSNNNISFTKSFINTTTSKLAYLYLDSCNLTEFPQFIGYLSKLEVLHLQYNRIRGNQLRNGFPSSLTYLDLSSNDLHGDILGTLRNLKDLEELYLESLNLNGVLDVNDLFTLNNLRILDLSNNNISFTKSFINATTSKIAYLYLDSCNLTEFPRFIGYLSELEKLSLKHNRIQGIIPRWMWNNSKESLQEMHLSHNLLTGFENNQTNLPLPNLNYLDVSSNSLETTLPIPPPSIMVYNISNNFLSGEVPTSICEARSLTVLDLSNNTLNGTLPPCLGSIGPLILLNLATNKFDGMIPRFYLDGCAMRMIDLRENQLSGIVSRSLGNCRMLEYLNLGDNQINDTFPFWLSELAYLKVIGLRSNNFHGPIESHLSQLNFTSLHILDISNNSFNGKFPSNLLKSCHAMKVMVGQNELEYLNIYQFLHWFNVSFSISTTYAMKLMNKGTKREYAKIPDVLVAIDLSNNKFEGFIPDLIGNLKALRVLNLSNNFFIGSIPPSLANLTVLESLDLSWNNLSGEIPQQLASLTFLSVFKISHNHLSGPIPRGTQFDTFGSNSFAMNDGLCGSPLPNKCTNGENSPPLSSHFKVDNEEECLFDMDWRIVLVGNGVGFLVGIVLENLIIDGKSMRFLHYSKKMAKGWKKVRKALADKKICS